MKTAAALTRALSEIQRVLDEAAARGGKHQFANGAVGYGHTPEVAPEAWLHVTFPPLVNAQQTDVELRIDVALPDEYRAFLKFSNGLQLFDGSLHAFGQRRSYQREAEAREPFDLEIPNVDERPRDAPVDAFFVAAYGLDGSMIYLRGNGEAILCRRRSAEPVCRWESFGAYLLEEILRLDALSKVGDLPMAPPA